MNDKKTSFIGIIPARYASTRFPGKPLADINGRTMIERVYNSASKVLDDVVVATDDERIRRAVETFGGRVVMTSTDHRSGTDRVCEAYHNVGSDADVVINIQGDEPFIATDQIRHLMECFDNAGTDIATLARKFDKSQGFEALFDPNLVKVTFADNGRALYFSRSIIPYVRGHEWKEWLDSTDFYTHIGMYAYRIRALERITAMPQTSLEKTESLEQLRWLQNGMNIAVAITDTPTIGIDTPADLEAAREYCTRNNL